MYIEDTQCCAVNEIAHLSDHTNPREAMKAWCETELGGVRDYDYYGDDSDVVPFSFYIFTGVIKHTDGTRPKFNGKYGPNFAKLIKRYKLGKLTQSVLRSNRVNHPKHFVRIWTWAPSIRNCKKWYKKEFPNG